MWMELWLRAVRHPELQPVAEGLYARLHEWFADEIAAGIAAGEFAPCDADGLADRTLSLCDGLGVRHVIGDRDGLVRRSPVTLVTARWPVTSGWTGSSLTRSVSVP